MKNQLSLVIVLAILFCGPSVLAQTNLIDTSEWTVGADVDSMTQFEGYHGTNSNSIVVGTDPFGQANRPMWRIEDGDGQVEYPGMFTNGLGTYDKDKTYQFSFWIKVTNVSEGPIGITINGLNNDEFISDGGPNKWHYFKSYGSVPSANEWYLFIGYVNGIANQNGSGSEFHSASGTQYNGNAWFNDGVGAFANNFLTGRFGVWLNDETSNNNVIHIYDPAIYLVDGTEPSVNELLNPGGSPPDCSSSQLATQYRINGVWASGAASITLDESDDVMFSGTPDILPVSITDPSGTVHGDDYEIQGITASNAGTYIITDTSSGCTKTLQVTINGTTPPPTGDSPWTTSGSTASIGNSGTITNVAIGTTAVPNGFKMAVDGNIIAEEIKVQSSGDWPDYVFSKNYDLPTLEEIKNHIKEKGHLPNMPSAQEVETNGIELGEMDRLLLEKIEQLTLYILQQQEEIQLLKDKVKNK